MLRTTLTLIFVLSSQVVWSQLTPKKIKNNDLRSSKEVISISYSGKKKQENYSLNKTPQGEFHINHNVDKKLVKSQKVASQSATQFDETFADKFITMKYMMKSAPKKSACKNSYKLFMHGEDYEVCESDQPRVSMIQELINLFKKKLI